MPSYNGETLTITLDAGVTSVDWGDVYSGWKDWLREGSNLKYPQAFRTTGGDPYGALLNTGSYWFLRNDMGWRIKPPEENITILATGNLAPEDADTEMFIPTEGAYTTQILGLQPITQGLTEGSDVDQWMAPMDDYNTPGTMGVAVKQTRFWINALRRLM